jgi:hypothetical protein
MLCVCCMSLYHEDVWAMKEQLHKFLTLALDGSGEVLTLVTLSLGDIPSASECDWVSILQGWKCPPKKLPCRNQALNFLSRASTNVSVHFYWLQYSQS